MSSLSRIEQQANADLARLAKRKPNGRVVPIGEPVRRHLLPVSTDALDGAAIAPPRFVVEHLLPRRVVTLLGAHGGSGKSMLALTIAAHVAAGAAWAGFTSVSSPVLLVSLEDPGDVVLYRLRRVLEQYRLPEASIRSQLRILDGTDGDALAGEVAEHGVKRLAPLPALNELQEAAAGAGLIVIDNASDGLDASENDRRMVRTFLRQMLGRIARENDAAVLLLAHIDKNAARYGANGNTYSGSTAWHNSARSRLALIESEGRLELVHEKSNFGKTASPVALSWNAAGVLVPSTGPDPVQTAVAEQAAQNDADAVLAAVRAAAAAGITVPAGRSGPNTAWHVLASFPELPDGLRTKAGRERFWRAVTRLTCVSAIVEETYRNEQRHPKQRLVPAEGAPVECARQSPYNPLRTDARAGSAAPVCASSITAAQLPRTAADADPFAILEGL